MKVAELLKKLRGFMFSKLGKIILGSALVIFLVLVVVFGIRVQNQFIRKFLPRDGANINSEIEFIFNKPVVDKKRVGKAFYSFPIKYYPGIDGTYKWIRDNRLVFYPAQPLLPSMEYRITVLPEMEKVIKQDLKGKKDYAFSTERIDIESGRAFLEIGHPRREMARVKIGMEFNYPVDPQLFKEAARLVDKDDKNIEFDVEPLHANKIITMITPLMPIIDERMKVTVEINKKLTCLDGFLGLEEDYIREFTIITRKDLKVTHLIKGESSPVEDVITIEFSAPVNPMELVDYIRLEPDSEFRIEEELNYIHLKGDFKVGEVYRVHISSGLLAKDGSRLKRQYSGEVILKDLEPYISFVSKGAFLSSRGKLKLGVESINVDSFNVVIKKVFLNNLIYFLNTNRDVFFKHSGGSYDYYHNRNINNFSYIGKDISSKRISVDVKRNRKTTTPVDLRSLFESEFKGIYKLHMYSNQNTRKSDWKWVLITDIGMIAKKYGDELMIMVNSLSKLNALSNVKISIMSRTNQVLASKYTDGNGIVKFKNYSKLTSGYSPFIITAEKGDDYSFLDFNNCKLSTVDFDVDGENVLSDQMKGFIYLERDIYRPGENAKLVCIVRNKHNQPKADYPLKLNVMDPRDKTFKKYSFRMPANGSREFELDFPDYAKTGFYTAKLIAAGAEIGRCKFQVEDFMPDRMKVSARTDKEDYMSGEEIKVEVSADYLFGAPAAGCDVEVECDVEARKFMSKDFNDFTFYNEDMVFDALELDVGEGKTNKNGKKEFTFSLPESLRPPGRLGIQLSATVQEEGGRAVTARARAYYDYYDLYVGVRKDFKDRARVGDKLKFSVIAVKPDNQVVAGETLEVFLIRKYWHSVLKRNRRGKYRYVSEMTEEIVEKKVIKSKAGPEAVYFFTRKYGEHRVEVFSTKSKFSTSVSFETRGDGYAPWAITNPDRLQLTFEKESYLPGETAKLQVKAPYSGKLIVFYEREKVFGHAVHMMKDNTAVISIPVYPSYKPNIYVSAFLLHSVDTLEPHSPPRAFGIVPLMVTCADKKLDINITCPVEVQPGDILEVDLDITGAPGEKSWLTLAGVDEGICQLTDFSTPDPFAYFYNKKKLLINSYDIYSFVLPELTEARGGGAWVDKAGQKGPSSIARVKPVSLWSGIVSTDYQGKAKVKFEVPKFNGSLRLMAVAHSKDRFGSNSTNVTIREPIIIMPTFPRFVTGGDNLEIPVVVFNGTGREDNFRIKIKIDGPLTVAGDLTKEVKIKPETEEVVVFPINVWGRIGSGHLNISVKGGGETADVDIDFPIRPPVQRMKVAGNGMVQPGEKVEIELPDYWMKDTHISSIAISPTPLIKYIGGLKYLLRYPHGCVEQTSSKTFPLLYMKEIVQRIAPDLFKKHNIDSYVQKGVARLISMQMSNGDLAYWPGGRYANAWGSVYGSHCLVEAKKSGYVVSQSVMDGLRRSLVRYSKGHSSSRRNRNSRNLQVKVYACYVLALMGHPEVPTMNYLKKQQLSSMSQFSRAQLAGAYFMAGERITALEVLPAKIANEMFDRETGGNFNSTIRANAILLSSLLEIDSNNEAVPVLIDKLTSSVNKKTGRWPTTQDNAFALMALGKIMKKGAGGLYSGVLRLNGKKVGNFDSRDDYVYKGRNWAGKKLTLELSSSKGLASYSWSSEGLKEDSKIETYNHKIFVWRSYFDKDGNRYNTNSIKQGDIVIAKVKVFGAEGDYKNIVIVDLFPSGLEIENQRLQSRKNISWISDTEVEIDYMDIRDDRINIFLSVNRQETKELYYTLRAVTAGTFILPPIKAEAMYDPSIVSVSSNGEITISRK